MQDSLNKAPISEDTVSSIISAKGFDKLDKENQKLIIDAINKGKERDGGLLGKFFGNKKDNAAMNMAFVLCLLLSVIGIITMCHGQNFWNLIISAITSVVGYIFGRSSSDRS